MLQIQGVLLTQLEYAPAPPQPKMDKDLHHYMKKILAQYLLFMSICIVLWVESPILEVR